MEEDCHWCDVFSNIPMIHLVRNYQVILRDLQKQHLSLSVKLLKSGGYLVKFFQKNYKQLIALKLRKTDALQFFKRIPKC